MNIANMKPLEGQMGLPPFSIVDVTRRIWRGKFLIALCGAVGLLLASVYLHIAEYSYTARMILVPTQGQNVGATTGQLGQLAMMAGVDLNRGQSVSPFLLYQDAITTREVADDMARRRPDIMQQLFKGEWDPVAKKWFKPGGPVREVVKFVKSVLGVPNLPWHPPGGAELQRFVETKVSLSQDVRRPVLTLTVSDKDPALAMHILQGLHDSTDRVLRQITLDRSSKYAAYVENKLLTVQLTELRQVLTNTLRDQETLLMMSSSDAPFAAQPLGPPERSLKPTKPVPILSLVFGLVMGGTVGLLLALFGPGLTSLFRSRRPPMAQST